MGTFGSRRSVNQQVNIHLVSESKLHTHMHGDVFGAGVL